MGEQNELAALLPSGSDKKNTVANLLKGEQFHFGSPLDNCWSQMKAGLLHPSILPYKQKAEELMKIEAMQARRDLHNNMVYRLLKRGEAQNKPYDSDSSADGDG